MAGEQLPPREGRMASRARKAARAQMAKLKALRTGRQNNTRDQHGPQRNHQWYACVARLDGVDCHR